MAAYEFDDRDSITRCHAHNHAETHPGSCKMDPGPCVPESSVARPWNWALILM
jgi:hypothetical protein